MSSSRKHHLKSVMLAIAKGILEEEAREREEERRRYMAQSCPPLDLPTGMHELQELCREIHQKIDVIDEERYDLEVKVNKSSKEIEDLKIKVQDLMGKFKKPTLKKVRMSADAMLKALLGSKHTVNLDLRANLKQVKKEVKEEVGSQGQQPKQGSPDFTLPSYFVQLLPADPEVFPGQLRDIVSPTCPGSSPRPPTGWTCPEGVWEAS
ncbi:troponin I, fast skeletal muscle-like isoform X2 [Dunckerocampus dactyliophorus]|nr:troponin I, fast skeletal muscle-like isoform X2 [Dunckerocampus dactyliophorus]XP_054631869.1 troponin I, fast skeletal muscle-like isoform X2 [Dunckerocampus dactyliophorus]